VQTYSDLAERALRDEPPTASQCRWILDGEDVELLPLLHAAFIPRERHFGREVMVHILNNVQNGLCPEDCGYCSQSKDSVSGIRKYPLKSDEEIFAAAEEAAQAGASRYCMVLSGRSPTPERTRKLAELIRGVKQRYPIEVCLSAGFVDEAQARILAGLIMGMGESSGDLVEVGMRLRELEVDSIPVNFLIPIDGNPVLSDGSLTPERCLRALALMRLINPRAEIRVAGGREGHLRGLGALALWPANSLFVEGYLTTRGDAVTETYAMIRDAGFEVAGNALTEREGRENESPRFRLPGDAPLLKPDVVPGA
jgi:biotin synthase